MSFAIGFNLTVSVIHVVTFGRVKLPAHPLHGRHLPVAQGDVWYWSEYKFLLFVRDGNKLIAPPATVVPTRLTPTVRTHRLG